MNYPSKLVEEAVNEIAKLPSIGKKTALRLVLHLLKQEEAFTQSLTQALTKLRTETNYCIECHNISDTTICNICANKLRDRSLVCVVEDMRDVIAIENTHQYNGLYHVLGGVISPIEGISPNELNIDSLIQRVSQHTEIKEIILAISATMEGDTTAFYITKKLQPFHVKVTTLARGVPVGSELEYTDEITLGRSILSRVNYEQ
jgi:recombination protein RecR